MIDRLASSPWTVLALCLASIALFWAIDRIDRGGDQ